MEETERYHRLYFEAWGYCHQQQPQPSVYQGAHYRSFQVRYF